jgi:hypothetical protein
VASKKATTRAVYAAYSVLASAFVFATVWQVAGVLFGTPAEGAAVGPACAEGLRDLSVAIDRGLAAAAGARDRDAAEERYRAALRPEWDRKDAIADVCGRDRTGADALAALGRVDRAARESASRSASELGSVRRDLDSFIRGAR